MLETRDVPGATELEAPSRRPRSTGERHAAQHLAEACRADRPEALTRTGERAEQPDQALRQS